MKYYPYLCVQGPQLSKYLDATVKCARFFVDMDTLAYAITTVSKIGNVSLDNCQVVASFNLENNVKDTSVGG